MIIEEKLNIANILKDKPIGTKLYTDAFGKLKLERITVAEEDIIYTRSKIFTLHSFYSDGKYSKDGEPILVPSKKMHDWNKFAWKQGDILVSDDGKSHVIFSRWYDDNYTSFYGKHYLNKENKDKALYYRMLVCTTKTYSLEDKDATETYINAIEEKLGGKLNLKTLEVEKTQLEFKDGDIVTTDARPSLCYSKCIFILKGDLSTNEKQAHSYVFYNVENNNVDFNVLATMIRSRNIRLAIEVEKETLFEALARKGKYWNAEKKVIEDIKKEYQLKPFDKVLVRDSYNDMWRANLFSHIREDGRDVTTGLVWNFCIPYIGNESLLGTTKGVED